jgi:hypothetical protein
VIKAAIARASSAAIGRVSVFLLEADVVVVCIKKIPQIEVVSALCRALPDSVLVGEKKKNRQ